MFSKLILLGVLAVGTAFAQNENCEKLLFPGEFYKASIEKCIELQKRPEKVLSVHDSIRESGKNIENNRAPSVEVMYRKRRSSKQ